MKRYLILLALATIALAGCQKESAFEDSREQFRNADVFQAAMADADTKVFIDSNLRMFWMKDDRISIFDCSTVNKQYRFLGETGDKSGDFGVIPSDSKTGTKLKSIYAVFPYLESTEITTNEAFILIQLPEEQFYCEGSFGPGANTMMAVSKDISSSSLLFKNACGFLKMKFYGEGKVKSIAITGNDLEFLAGRADITLSTPNEPSLSLTENYGTSRLVLNCGEGVELSKSADSPTEFWFCIPPTTFSKGFTVTLTDTEGRTITKRVTSSKTITRNVVNTMAALEVKFEKPAIKALRFTASAEQSISLISTSPDSPSVQYSFDGETWTDWDHSPLTFGTDSNPEVYLRGNNPDGFRTSSNYAHFVFGNIARVQCDGNIMHLLNYTEDLKAIPNEQCFSNIFSNCQCLEKGPELPATSLKPQCYQSMFDQCTNLSQAPELPATTMEEDCYRCMFRNCFRISKAPDLPATKLAERCYQSMFSGCTTLKSAPELPATTLEANCYRNMFDSCTGLVYAPDLPAVNLADNCCYMMFYFCNHLTSAPELPAKELKPYCYYMMFNGCGQLIYVKCLAEDSSESNYTYNWLNPNSKSGTFIKSPKNNSWKTGSSGIPTGWQVVDDAE